LCRSLSCVNSRGSLDIEGFDKVWKAINWLIKSGIINDNPSNEDVFGSVNSYFDPSKGNYGYAFSEITGYALTTFTYLYNLYGGEAFLKLADNGFRWLRDKAFDKRINGCFCRYDYKVGDFNPKRVCSFDNGMILNGLVSLYRVTKDAEIIDLALKIGDWLVDDMQNEDGSFNVRYVYRDGIARIDFSYDKWSSQCGSFLCKIGIGLLNLYDVTGEDKYKEAAGNSGDRALKFQCDDGRFITNLLEHHTHLHPHSYTCEGLFVLGHYLDDEKYLSSAIKGTRWSLRVINKSNGFPRKYLIDEIIRYERNDINAQSVRLMILSILNGYEIPPLQIKGAVENMLRYQVKSPNGRMDGAFIYGFNYDGREMPHPNSWVTMFSIQALLMYDQILLKGKSFDYFNLI